MYKITLLVTMSLAAYIGYAYANYLNQKNIFVTSYKTEFEQCVEQNKATKNHEMICLHLTDLEF